MVRSEEELQLLAREERKQDEVLLVKSRRLQEEEGRIDFEDRSELVAKEEEW